MKEMPHLEKRGGALLYLQSLLGKKGKSPDERGGEKKGDHLPGYYSQRGGSPTAPKNFLRRKGGGNQQRLTSKPACLKKEDGLLPSSRERKGAHARNANKKIRLALEACFANLKGEIACLLLRKKNVREWHSRLACRKDSTSEKVLDLGGKKVGG